MSIANGLPAAVTTFVAPSFSTVNDHSTAWEDNAATQMAAVATIPYVKRCMDFSPEYDCDTGHFDNGLDRLHP